MRIRFGLAARVSRLWVRLYTSGMPRALRDARRAEIDADLWDHEADRRSDGAPRMGAASEILRRTLFGVPDDLAWRFETIRARRLAAHERRTAMVSLSDNQIRWLGIAGMAWGVLWAGRYLVPLDPGPAVSAYGHIALAILLLLGLAGFHAQQRTHAGTAARIGFGLLFTSAGAWLAMNVLGTVFRLPDQTLVMNLLGVAFFLPLAPGFLLLSAGLRGRARVIPLAIVVAFAVWYVIPQTPLVAYFPPGTQWKRGDSPLGTAAFFVMGGGLAALGYSVLRNPRRPQSGT